MIALERIEKLDLLPRLFSPVLAPPAVQREFGHTVEWLTVAPPTTPMIAAALGLVLGPGESEAIALAAERNCRVILDDRQARAAAARLDVKIIGTAGLLLRAKRENMTPELRPLLDALDEVGFRIGTDLRRRVLKLAGETSF